MILGGDPKRDAALARLLDLLADLEREERECFADGEVTTITPEIAERDEAEVPVEQPASGVVVQPGQAAVGTLGGTVRNVVDRVVDRVGAPSEPCQTDFALPTAP